MAPAKTMAKKNLKRAADSDGFELPPKHLTVKADPYPPIAEYKIRKVTSFELPLWGHGSLRPGVERGSRGQIKHHFRGMFSMHLEDT
ncbi:hypothetical protein NPIL_419421 [Nephila pilipes]|uniref:Uncharacterized protein n=1 Tax=Nephila pilipes TaxID=299642 RepID=A0A8X6QNE1_NEPPI|nr:hypothetical protein NPIL_419421 [Nephila pilipes]